MRINYEMKIVNGIQAKYEINAENKGNENTRKTY